MSETKGKNEVLGGGGFHHIAINTGDFDASVRFYTEVLGFTKALCWQNGAQRAVMLDTGDGACIEMFSDTASKRGQEGPVIHFALRTTKCDAIIERVRAAGMEITAEPNDVTIASDPPVDIRIAFFNGPNGESIELFQYR